MQIEVWALFVDEVILAELNCSFFFLQAQRCVLKLHLAHLLLIV